MNPYRLPGAPARTSPRQAILVDAGDLRPPSSRPADPLVDPWPEELRRAVLLDLLGSLVGVNGASIAVVAAGAAHAHAIAALIPPGIDIVSPPADAAEHGGRFVWAIAHHLNRAFTGVVTLAADLPALPTRTVATALSSLNTADVVVGSSTGPGLYLLGVRDAAGLDVAAAAGAATGFAGLTSTAMIAAARDRGAVLRHVERRARLADDDRVAHLQDAIAAAPAAAPRTAALLHARHDADQTGSGFPAAVGGIGLDFVRGLDH